MPVTTTKFGVLDGRYRHRATPTIDVADGTTSVDVSGGMEFKINNTADTTITAFTGMVNGQCVNLNFDDDGYTTLQHNSLIRLKDKEDFRSYAGARVCLYYDGTYFREAN